MEMKYIWTVSVLVVIVGAAAFLAGCGETTYVREPVLVGVPLPMTTGDVVAAAKGGATEDAILAQLRGRGYNGALTATDVDQLRTDGVPEGAINWMLAHPAPEPMRSAPIVGEPRQVVYVDRAPEVVYVDRSPDMVYVDRVPDVVVVERPPRVTYSIGMSYSWGSHPYYHRSYYRHPYPRTRVYHSGGRVYRYTSGH
jgi:hypothetical protein